jgi:hypothetical protein
MPARQPRRDCTGRESMKPMKASACAQFARQQCWPATRDPFQRNRKESVQPRKDAVRAFSALRQSLAPGIAFDQKAQNAARSRLCRGSTATKSSAIHNQPHAQACAQWYPGEDLNPHMADQGLPWNLCHAVRLSIKQIPRVRVRVSRRTDCFLGRSVRHALRHDGGPWRPEALLRRDCLHRRRAQDNAAGQGGAGGRQGLNRSLRPGSA